MPLPAGTCLGPYEILSPIGAGGMGEVYRARDPRLGRDVAVKVLPEALALDPGRLSRFQQEARSASALNHPNIVTVHEIGRDGETAFIAMELVEGKTLRELTVPGPMPVRRVLNVAAQVAEGLAKAHSAGIVHRDLKPENVMVSKDGFVKILDFGLAKLVEPEPGEASAMPTVAPPETSPGTVMGTVGYMSPEQASGEDLDFRSDQFSLGSIVYEMTTGKKAFQRKTAAETMSAIIREEPEPVARLRPDLPLPVRWILDRCLAKDREERYASTRDLARDLASVRDHISEVSSGAESMLAASGKSKRRAVPAAAAVALAAAALLAGALGTRALAGKGPTAPSFKRLTFRGLPLANARFSPDGQGIVYGVNLTDGTRLFMTRVQGPESKPFEFAGDILSISRSGEMAIRQGAAAPGVLATVPMVGGAPRQVVDGVIYAGADWSPEGGNLVVVRNVGGKTRLEFPVGKEIAAGNFEAPRFSPDGATISCWERLGDSYSLVLFDRLGKSKRTLSAGWSDISGVPSWSPSGREVWFAASRSGETPALWAMSMSGKLRLAIRVPGLLELDDISADGRVLVAHHTTRRSVVGFGPGQTKPIDLAWLDGSWPADLSLDGASLLLNEEGEGAGPGPAIYLRGTDGSPALRLSDGWGMALSADQKWVLGVSGGSGKPSSLVLVPTGPGEVRRLEIEGVDVRSGFPWGGFTPDSKRIVFSGTERDGKSRLHVLEISTGKWHALGPDSARILPFSTPVSPDGRFVVGVREGRAWVWPLDGSGEARAVPGFVQGDRLAQWTSDSAALYVYNPGERPMWVSLLDLATGQKHPWKEIHLADAASAVRVRVTPDGRAWICGSESGQSELYLVEGLR